jgi:hypothetical protein
MVPLGVEDVTEVIVGVASIVYPKAWVALDPRAVTVKVPVPVLEGVPVMRPVSASIERPAGKSGDDHAPVGSGVCAKRAL